MSRETEFLLSCFRDYYRRAPPPVPEAFRQREFGFMFFDRDFVRRHVGFQDESDYQRFLLNQVPSHAYYSSARYERPAASTMDLKGWLGADLIFDLDADHIRGAEGLSYQDMLRLVKKEIVTLLDRFIFGEFGFDEECVRVNFSGGRGYHVHVSHPGVLRLGAHERGEIIDFVTGMDLDMEWIFESSTSLIKDFKDRKKAEIAVSIPSARDGGWRGLARESLLQLGKEVGMMSNEGLRERFPSLANVKESTLEQLRRELHEERGGSSGLELMLRDDSFDYFTNDRVRDIFVQLVKDELKVRMSGQIDEPVTRDIKRLIRLPGSLHGKTGLRVVTLSRDELDGFDPLRDAVPETYPSTMTRIVLKSPLDIVIKDFRVTGEGTIDVPTYAAVFLLARKWASLE